MSEPVSRGRTLTIIRQDHATLELIAKQTEAQEWIQSVLNISFEQYGKNFQQAIQNGVLLSRLAQAISPKCLKKKPYPLGDTVPESQKWKMIENLTQFIIACTDEFGMKKIQTFNPVDLVESRNLMSVVNCIHTLADIAEARGFTPTMQKLQTTGYFSQQTRKSVKKVDFNPPSQDNKAAPANAGATQQTQLATTPQTQTPQPEPTQAKEPQKEALKPEAPTSQEKKDEPSPAQDDKPPKSPLTYKDKVKSRKERSQSLMKALNNAGIDELSSEDESDEDTPRPVETERKYTIADHVLVSPPGSSSNLPVQTPEPTTSPATPDTKASSSSSESDDPEVIIHEDVEPKKPAHLDNKPKHKQMRKSRRNTELKSSAQQTPPESPSTSNANHTPTPKKAAVASASPDLSNPTPGSSPGHSDLTASGERRRTWKLHAMQYQKTTRHSIDPSHELTRLQAIENYYSSLKTEAEKLNNASVIDDQINQQKNSFQEELAHAQRVKLSAEPAVVQEESEETEEMRKERMRVETINEIFVSERYYVRDLNVIVKLFMEPMIAKQLISPTDTQLLFGNIELILKVNDEIVQCLMADYEACSENMQLMNIGSDFIKLVDYLKIYSIFSSSYANSMAAYERLKRDSKEFSAFVREVQSKPECQGVDLLGFLIKPVQRVCKYPLLFKELLKNTPPLHVDYPNIENCLKKVHEVAEYVNEKQRTIESLHKMLMIQENLVDAKGFHIVEPARMFLREATFIKVNQAGKQQERICFLFNDMLLYCKPVFYKKTAYQYKGYIPLNFCLVNDLPNIKDLENVFEIVRVDSKRKYVFSATSAHEKGVWMADLQRIVDKNLQKFAAQRNSERLSQIQ